MGAPVNREQLAVAGPGLAPAPMPAARPPLRHKAGLLKGELDEAVRQRHGVLTPGHVMEVAHIEAAVLVPIQLQDALHLQRGRVAAPGLAPAIVQAERAVRFKPDPPAAQAARIEAQNVGRLYHVLPTIELARVDGHTPCLI